jgi:hypothetical protein
MFNAGRCGDMPELSSVAREQLQQSRRRMQKNRDVKARRKGEASARAVMVAVPCNRKGSGGSRELGRCGSVGVRKQPCGMTMFPAQGCT